MKRKKPKRCYAKPLAKKGAIFCSRETYQRFKDLFESAGYTHAVEFPSSQFTATQQTTQAVRSLGAVH